MNFTVSKQLLLFCYVFSDLGIDTDFSLKGLCLVAVKSVTTKGTFLCHTLSCTYNESHILYFYIPF